MSNPEVVDARGTRCPVPVVRVARAARSLAPGEVVVLLADDEAARSDVPAWARMRGHGLTVEDDGTWTRYTVRVAGTTSDGSGEARST
ncbi:sulfurtransferase TusA family protein [Phycicoccus sp. CSK15P-2]|uniref:sulfurtransferase TusA family protein n=1 Tax=Phycicoccus sp. CSK15P-2 TaxID=2807627 RepID=UPI00194E4CAB|nr:sulfurtransferase TusA family protein [Phycicoccus sp. CSK15P-2]MBM6404063.1 sulfurtransferase TusA family protein [Phycicoccus sp. CSK15P-2]